MDHAGAVFIGTAILMVFGRVVVAYHRSHAIQAALTQHHAPKEPRVRALLAKVDPRLRLGVVLGLVAVACGLLPAAIQEYVGSDSAIGRASGVTLRWVLLAGMVGSVRKWVLGRAAPAAGAARQPS